MTCPLRVAIMTKTFAIEILNRQQRADFFVRREIGEIDDRLALSGRADIRNLIDLQPVEPAAVGEDEHVAVRIRDEDIGDRVFVARASFRCGLCRRGPGCDRQKAACA